MFLDASIFKLIVRNTALDTLWNWANVSFDSNEFCSPDETQFFESIQKEMFFNENFIFWEFGVQKSHTEIPCEYLTYFKRYWKS